MLDIYKINMTLLAMPASKAQMDQGFSGIFLRQPGRIQPCSGPG